MYPLALMLAGLLPASRFDLASAPFVWKAQLGSAWRSPWVDSWPLPSPQPLAQPWNSKTQSGVLVRDWGPWTVTVVDAACGTHLSCLCSPPTNWNRHLARGPGTIRSDRSDRYYQSWASTTISWTRPKWTCPIWARPQS